MFVIFFLIIDLHLSIPENIAQILIPTAELAITRGIPTEEVKAEMKTNPATVEPKISKCSI